MMSSCTIIELISIAAFEIRDKGWELGSIAGVRCTAERVDPKHPVARQEAKHSNAWHMEIRAHTGSKIWQEDMTNIKQKQIQGHQVERSSNNGKNDDGQKEYIHGKSIKVEGELTPVGFEPTPFRTGA